MIWVMDSSVNSRQFTGRQRTEKRLSISRLMVWARPLWGSVELSSTIKGFPSSCSSVIIPFLRLQIVLPGECP